MEVPQGCTTAEVVDFVIDAALRRTPDTEIEAALRSAFGFSPEDASLARDRVFGRIMRAATRNRGNRPNRKRDYLAWVWSRDGRRSHRRVDLSAICFACKKALVEALVQQIIGPQERLQASSRSCQGSF